MRNSFELVGKSGKSYGSSYSVNRLKDRFMNSNEESAQVKVQFVKDPPVLEVNRKTSNTEWNAFNRKYAINQQND